VAKKAKKTELWIVLADGLRCGEAKTQKEANDLRDNLVCKMPRGFSVEFTVKRVDSSAQA
jgi:hypothetical protein